ncbi:MAG: response regulator, partial [Candidatus Anammoxibacter sp.]
MKILVADDDPATRFIVEDSLIEWGYDVVTAGDGEQAMEAIMGEDPPRIAVVDWLMPGLDGIEFCKKVKERADTPFVYIILLTSKTETKDVVEGLNAGADDFLKKPVDLAELKSRLTVGVRTINYEKMLLDSEKKVRIECYNALSALAETRDNETGMHLKRISMYCRILSERLGMGKDFMQEIELFSPMHDIGKVGIPDNILLAPRKLTKEEFEVMKTHSTLGFQILEN